MLHFTKHFAETVEITGDNTCWCIEKRADGWDLHQETWSWNWAIEPFGTFSYFTNRLILAWYLPLPFAHKTKAELSGVDYHRFVKERKTPEAQIWCLDFEKTKFKGWSHFLVVHYLKILICFKGWNDIGYIRKWILCWCL